MLLTNPTWFNVSHVSNVFWVFKSWTSQDSILATLVVDGVCGWGFGLACMPTGFDPVTPWLMWYMFKSFVITLGLIYFVEYLERYDFW